MDKAVLKMLENLKEKTGHSLEEWKSLIAKQKLSMLLPKNRTGS
jgi:hypothetical protein